MNGLTRTLTALHQRGSHCTTSALRNLLHHAGHRFSEDACLGLGCGLGFSYYKVPGMPLYSFNGRTRGIERTLCRLMGVDMEMHHSLDRGSFRDFLAAFADSGTPLLMNMDWTRVPYLSQKFRGGITDRILLAEHSNILAAVEGEEAVCIEYYSAEPTRLPLSTLYEAMASVMEEKALGTVCYRFAIPRRLTALDEAMALAIYLNSHDMAWGFGSNFGLEGMQRFFEEFFKWPAAMGEDEFRRNCAMAYTSLEKWGNGGGNFRLMYSRFLKEVAARFSCAYMLEWSYRYADLARQWKRAALALAGLAEPGRGGTYGSPAFEAGLERRFRELFGRILTEETQLNQHLNEWSKARLS